ncbi:hypothetical protein AB0Q95_45855 [Streptomyces sp. NPDC059900]|uniref:hypothetical protein n=1 Tax=Streptomyces sp. NPDC059900 TaxID=3155816 RepID=UPI00343A32FA
MSLSDGISNTLAALSLLVAVAAFLYARTQAKAAEQANTAAAKANEIALDANRIAHEANGTSQQALDVSRAQLDAELQAQHRADEPTFEVIEAVKEMSGEFFARSTLRQTGGVGLERAELVVSGTDVRWARADANPQSEVLSEPVVWCNPSRGSEQRLCVELEYRHMDPVTVTIHLACHASRRALVGDMAQCTTGDPSHHHILAFRQESRPLTLRSYTWPCGVGDGRSEDVGDAVHVLGGDGLGVTADAFQQTRASAQVRGCPFSGLWFCGPPITGSAQSPASELGRDCFSLPHSGSHLARADRGRSGRDPRCHRPRTGNDGGPRCERGLRRDHHIVPAAVQ